jgi:hypothetical protein
MKTGKGGEQKIMLNTNPRFEHLSDSALKHEIYEAAREMRHWPVDSDMHTDWSERLALLMREQKARSELFAR